MSVENTLKDSLMFLAQMIFRYVTRKSSRVKKPPMFDTQYLREYDNWFSIIGAFFTVV
jgi:hypothetical protein